MRQVYLVRMTSENQKASGYTSGSFGVGSEVAQGVHLSMSSLSMPSVRKTTGTEKISKKLRNDAKIL